MWGWFDCRHIIGEMTMINRHNMCTLSPSTPSTIYFVGEMWTADKQMKLCREEGARSVVGLFINFLPCAGLSALIPAQPKINLPREILFSHRRPTFYTSSMKTPYVQRWI